MAVEKKQTFLHGAAILAVGTMMVKAIGVLFKIPLNNLLDGVGMAYFSSAYTIFNTLYALSVAGLPIAVSRLVSQNAVLGRWREIQKILTLSRRLFFISGSVGFFVMLFAARSFAELVRNPGAYLAVTAMSPAVLFCCMTAAYRGYFQGLSNMYPTAVSQVIEALTKLVFGIGFAWIVINKLENEYKLTSTVLGMLAADDAQAAVIISQYSAAAAIAGIVVSTAFGTLYCRIRWKAGGDGITAEQLENSPKPSGSFGIIKELLRVAVPVCMGAVVLNVTSLIDMVSIMGCLEKAVLADADIVRKMYLPYFTKGLRTVDIPAYLYGCYAGIAVTMFNLIPAITSTIGVSALPAVTAAWVSGDREKTARSVESVLRVSGIVAFPAGLGLSVMARPAAELVFSRSPMEAAVGGQLLQVLALSAILVALSTPINSVLQAIGQMTLPVKLMLAGAVIKLGVNCMFIGIPQINIQAAPFGTLACYIIIIGMSLKYLNKHLGVKLRWNKVFGCSFASAILCAMAAWSSYGMLKLRISQPLATLVSIALGAVIYAISLLLMGGICKEDVVMLPKGEKIAKLLENKRFLR